MVWHPLLFRHVCLLTAAAGAAGCRYPAEGIAAALLLAVLYFSGPALETTVSTLPRGNAPHASFQFLHQYVRRLFPTLTGEKAALFLLFFLLGLGYANITANRAPSSVPAWITAASNPTNGTEDGDPDPLFSTGARIEGEVIETTRLPGGRFRLLLKNAAAEGEKEPLPGILVVSWRNPPPDLAAAGPGQMIRATLRIREIRGFANPGVWNTEAYWRDRGAFYRAWSADDGSRNGKNPPYVLLGETSGLWKARDALQTRVVAALMPGAISGIRPDVWPDIWPGLTGDAAPTGQAFPDGVSGQSRRSSQTGQTSQTGQAGQAGLSAPASFIPALLFGDRSYCPPRVLDLAARATLAHSLALSGMHLGFAAALGFGAAYLAALVFPSLLLFLPLRKLGLLLALPVCLAYLWLGGYPPSLLRAALMYLFWAVLAWLNRPRVLVDGLAWAVAVILAVSPGTVFDIRLQLSAVSVAGIALAAPMLERLAAMGRHAPSPARAALRGRWRAAFRGFLLVLAGMAGVSVAAQAASLPLTLNAFPGTGVWFPLNLVWLPLLGMWVMPLAFAGLFATAVGLSALAPVLFFAAELPCAALVGLLEWMDAAGILAAPVAPRPAWPACAGYWLLLLTLPLALMACGKGRMRGAYRRVAALTVLGVVLLLVPVAPALLPDREDTVTLRLIDVGQGQAALVSWRGKNGRGRALIDGGGFLSPTFDLGRDVITPVLTDNHLPVLDWAINSHPDADHLQGLLFPLETFRVHAVGLSPDPAKRTGVMDRRDAALAARNMRPRILRAGEVVTLSPGLELEVAHPPGHASGGAAGLSANDAALVLRLVWRGRPLVLICGDLERKGLGYLLASGHPLAAEALVLPHHGSAGSHSPDLYDAVRPSLALAACGYANQYHFPAKKVRRSLAERNIPLVTTADKGQITLTWREGKPMEAAYAR